MTLQSIEDATSKYAQENTINFGEDYEKTKFDFVSGVNFAMSELFKMYLNHNLEFRIGE